MDRTHDPTPGPLKRHFLRNILALTKVASETRTPRAVGSLSHIHVSVTMPRFNQPQSLTGGHRPRPGKRSETKLSPPTAAPYLSSHAAGGSPPSAVSVVFVPSLASLLHPSRSLTRSTPLRLRRLSPLRCSTPALFQLTPTRAQKFLGRAPSLMFCRPVSRTQNVSPIRLERVCCEFNVGFEENLFLHIKIKKVVGIPLSKVC